MTHGLGECIQGFGWEVGKKLQKSRLEDNIKLDLRVTGQRGMDSIHLARDRD
jgi:hypothetical protein